MSGPTTIPRYWVDESTERERKQRVLYRDVEMERRELMTRDGGRSATLHCEP